MRSVLCSRSAIYQPRPCLAPSSYSPLCFFPRFSYSLEGNKETPVTVEEVGAVRVVTLNRPKALNALNLDMIQLLTSHYQNWKKDDNIKAIILKGAGEKAFCAGGDIRAVYDEGVSQKKEGQLSTSQSLTHRFFKEEYQLNYLIANYPKPHISLLNGITMGGGMGLSTLGSHRLVNENCMIAMPETAIGFFCDVGGSHFLSRVALGFDVGLYLALSGARVKGADIIRTGLGTHFVQPDAYKTFRPQSFNEKDIQQIQLTPSGEGDLIKHQDAIHKCFGSAKCVEDIFISLEKNGSDWAKQTHEAMRKASPTSLKVVFKQIHEGRTKNLAECLKMEFRLSQNFMKGNDFFEGVRALLVDKDKNPRWEPASLEAIKDEDVDRFFAPLPNPNDELVLQ